MFISDDPTLFKEWNFEKNKEISPYDTTLGSNKRVWWKCSCGHEWEDKVYNRQRRAGCPFCNNRKVLSGFNDLLTKFPEIAQDWDYEQNKSIKPSEILFKSRQRVNWKCHHCGNRWNISVYSRTHNQSGCPECAKKIRAYNRNLKNLANRGSLADNSKLLSEWNYEKNLGLNPHDFTPKSNQYVWWKCSHCGYEWKAKISNRAFGRNCPCCSNKVVVKGVNDLKTIRPDLAAEWHPTKNLPLTPESVTSGSGKKVWWACPMGHEYIASILHRNQGTNCPICNSGRQTSFAEQAVYFYIKKIFPDAQSRVKDLIGQRMELDIYIPSKRIAIEYDGAFWHNPSKIKRDTKKYQLCQEKGIYLIRIREKRLQEDERIANESYSMEDFDLELLIRFFLDHLDPRSNMWTRKSIRDIHSPIIVDLKKDEHEIRNYAMQLRSGSLADLFPDIAKEWHNTKNGSLTPQKVKPGSDVRIWWKCSHCGYEWITSISKRTAKTGRTGCPSCARRRLKLENPNKKPIIQLSLDGQVIKEWDSISKAALTLKLNGSNISTCAKGLRNHCGGFKWRYKDSNH